MNLSVTGNPYCYNPYQYIINDTSQPKEVISFVDHTGHKYTGRSAVDRVNSSLKRVRTLATSLRDCVEMLSLGKITGEQKATYLEKMINNFLKDYQEECGALPESLLSEENEKEKGKNEEHVNQEKTESVQEKEKNEEEKSLKNPSIDILGRNPVEKKSSLFSAPKMTVHESKKKESKPLENKNPFAEFYKAVTGVDPFLPNGPSTQGVENPLKDVEITDCNED